MIACSKSADILARRSLGKDKIIISDIENLIKQLSIDASIANPKKEAFIVSEADIMKPKTRKEFLEAAANKHPSVKLIVIARAKTTLTSGNGINQLLMNPKPEQLVATVSELIESISDKVPIKSSFERMEEEQYIPREFKSEVEFTKESKEIIAEEATPITEELPVESVTVSEADPIITEEEAEEAMLQRIRNCNSIADVSIVAREITATKVVKDLLSENNEYVAIEEKLKALQQRIYAVMTDPTIPTLEEKWDKVRAITYDRSYYAAKGTTILEQRVEEIIKALGNKTQELLRQRMEDVDRAIIFYKNSQHIEAIDFPRLSSILDTRANLILDLAVIKKELISIFQSTDNLTAETSKEIVNTNTRVTGMPIIDNQLKARGEALTSSEGLEVINKILTAATINSQNFIEFQNSVELTNRKVAELLRTDDEIIEAQSEIIKYLSSKNIEETIVANSMIKKVLRIYTGEEGTGRTIVPYIISKLRSKTSANVLYLNLTGDNKLKDYSVCAIDFYDWLDTGVEKQFCVVAGEINLENMESIAQRLSNMLVKVADYYRVINVILKPDQKILLDILMPDVLSINYVTDMNIKNLEKTKELIENTTMANVAQKVIVNKCSHCTEGIVNRLGLGERINVGYLKVPYIPQVVECALNGINPSEIDIVQDLFTEVLHHA